MALPVRALIEGGPQLGASTPAQTSVGTDAGLILAQNHKRKSVIVQNTGTSIIKLTLGATLPTATAYHVALAACTAANDGKGGVWIDDGWIGAVNALSSAAGGTCVVTEITTGSPDWNQATDYGTFGHS